MSHAPARTFTGTTLLISPRTNPRVIMLENNDVLHLLGTPHGPYRRRLLHEYCCPLSKRRVIVLEDNDVLHLSGGGYGIYNTEGANVEEAVPRVLLTLQMEVEQIMKVGHVY